MPHGMDIDNEKNAFNVTKIVKKLPVSTLPIEQDDDAWLFGYLAIIVTMCMQCNKQSILETDLWLLFVLSHLLRQHFWFIMEILVDKTAHISFSINLNDSNCKFDLFKVDSNWIQIVI